MNKRLVHGISKAIFDSDLVATRFWLFLAEFLWAVMLFWPGDTFERPTYVQMGKIAPEMVWAFLFLLTAVIQLNIIINETYHEFWARCFSIWNAVLWTSTVTLMIFGVYPPPAAIGGEIALTVSAIWIAIRPIILDRGTKHATIL